MAGKDGHAPSADSAESRAQLGAKLLQTFQESGLTLQALSAKAGVSPNTIRAIFRGATSVNTALLMQVTHVLVRAEGATTPLPPPLLPEEISVALAYRRADIKLQGLITHLLMEAKPKGFDPAILGLAHELNALFPHEQASVRVLIEHFTHSRRTVWPTKKTVKSLRARQKKPDGEASGT